MECIRCIVYILILLSGLPLMAQADYAFKHVTAADGLPDNYVEGVFFIPDGRLGVRTPAAIHLYDGCKYVSFPYKSRNLYYWKQSVVPLSQYVDSLNLVWIKDRSLLRVLDLTKEGFVEDVDSLVRSFGVEDELSNMFVDGVGRHWFVNKKQGVYVYAAGELQAVSPDNSKDDRRVISINGGEKHCWLVYSDGLLRCWDVRSKRFVVEDNHFVDRIKPEDRVVLSMLSDGDFWMMWDNGVAYYDGQQRHWTFPDDFRREKQDMYTTLATDRKGNAWVGTGLSGVCMIHRKDFSQTHYDKIPLVDGKSVQNDVTNIAINRENNDVWIAFMFKGLAYHYSHMNRFSLFNARTLKGEMASEAVRCMVETEEGDILLGTFDGPLRYDPKTRTVDAPYKELSHKLCTALFRDSRNRIWAGTLYDGLYCIEKGKVTRHYYTPDIAYRVFQHEANYNSIRSILEDEKGRFWVSVVGGVCAFDPETGQFAPLSEEHPELSAYTVCPALAEDENHRLIVGSINGLFYYDPEKHTLWRPETDAPNDRRFIHSSVYYNHIFRDSRNLYWFGTQNGLNVVDMQQGKVYLLDSDDGMPNSGIKTILEDRGHTVWVSTMNGICKIDVSRNEEQYEFNVIGFGREEGVLNDDYYDDSGLVASDGMVYFGGLSGFSAFHPQEMDYSRTESHPVITGLYLFNVPLRPGEKYNGRVILDQSISCTRTLELDYDENFITLEFSGLNFSSPNQTYYKYRLEGFDKEWQEASFSKMSGRAVYTGLSHGEYTFYVYTAGSDKQWGKQPAKLHILIHPPFWDTVAARVCYFLLGIASVAGLVVYLNRRNKKRMLEMQQAEASRQKEELDQMKFRFFTNISHEFRTPLTLIITPLEAYMKRMPEGEERRKLSSIHRNALDLLALVNQLLDFRKLEMGGEKLNLLHGDFVEFVRQVYASFQGVADEKGIAFHLDTNGMEEVYMYFDSDKMHKVLNNLLSNAFKFTPMGGTVTLELEKGRQERHDSIVVKVSDTGVGISQEDIPQVFKRFYQVKSKEENNRTGSGIGLHLVKEHITLHQGSVAVESLLGQGSVFSVILPCDLRPEVPLAQPLPLKEEEPVETSSVQEENKPLLLLVEDNREFRLFLREQLGEFYRVLDAPDGEEGERLAIEQNPDLIVSDIMMPRVDGIELCRRIKTNLQTSHIPVILLTARASDESKAMGYDAGADSYISKPFSMEVLLTRIRKLIEQQKQRQEIFHKEIVVTPSDITITSLDEKLVQKALECVERNMDNTEYSVEELSADLAMTRATLYRKMQGITGQTPKDFIRSIRLKRAVQLLRDTDLSVSEISDRVGFSTPRHFSKLFKEAFNVLPSQYKEGERNE